MAPEADQSKPMSLKDEISQSEAINLQLSNQLDVSTEVNVKGKGNIFKKKEKFNATRKSGSFRVPAQT